MAEKIYIGGELESRATGNKVADVANIKDKTQGDKSQAEINAETQEALADRYTKEETYNKEELDSLITTPSPNYEAVEATEETTDVTDVLPATGEANTVYRVGSWDGTQFDATCYSEYAWKGDAYVHLSTKSQIGEVFDISAYRATGGTLAKYADLAAALDGGDNIPQSLRKGGMSVKFVLSSDNKYVQYRLLTDEWSTDTDDWAIVDGGIYVENPEFVEVHTDAEDKILYGVKSDGDFYFGAGVPKQVQEAIDITADTKVDKIPGKGLSTNDYADDAKEIVETQELVENPEYIQMTTDSEDKILECITSEGVKQINLPIDTPSATIKNINSPEFIELKTDSDNKIIESINSKGEKELNVKLFCHEDVNIDKELYIKGKNIEDFINTGTNWLDNDSELELNIIQLQRRENARANFSIHPKILSLLHFSDLHNGTIAYNPGNYGQLLRVLKVAKKYGGYINDVICTGDMTDYYEDSFNFWHTAGADGVLFTLGNHEIAHAPGYSGTITQQDLYDKYFSLYIGSWGVTNPTNKLYWYKDYDDQHIRLISVYNYLWKVDSNTMEGSTAYAEQLSWFEATLESARQSGLSVIVMNHFPVGEESITCNFTQDPHSIDSSFIEGIGEFDEFMDRIESFKLAGGSFICHVVGHTHFDIIGYKESYPDQLYVAVANASLNSTWGDCDRISGTRCQDNFNIISFDTYTKHVKIVKIGADINYNLGSRKVICFNYETKEIITQL